MRHVHLSFILTTLLVPVLCLAPVGETTGQGQRPVRGGGGNWDPVRFLDRLDRDDNGILDSRELNGRMRDYVRDQLGMDVSGTLTVESVLQRITATRDAKAREDRELERDGNRKVPKFGVANERAPVPGFGIETDDALQGNLEELYESGIVEATRSYMDRFDEDKNGVLSENEFRPILGLLGEDADKDGNGILAELEVAEALKNRRERQRSGGRGRDRGRGGENRNEGSQPASTQPTRPGRPAPPAPRRENASPSNAERFRSHINGVFEKYDTDKNGQLSPEERQDYKFDLQDSNGDGQISREEAIQSLANAGKASGGDNRGRQRGPDSGRGGDESASPRGGEGGDTDIGRDIRGFGRTQMPSQARSNSESEMRRNGASDKFMELDKNQDGQISMSEFARPSEWDDAKLENFRNMDLNDDGLVTIEEFRSGD